VWREGLVVELIDHFIEGFIPVHEIQGDFYQLDHATHALIGRRSREKFRLGDRLMVQVARVDKLLRRAFFVPVLARKRSSR
jgi:ribonuclease R